ncbi:MAG: SNF2-related protein [Sedimentisphaerales bacterium]
MRLVENQRRNIINNYLSKLKAVNQTDNLSISIRTNSQDTIIELPTLYEWKRVSINAPDIFIEPIPFTLKSPIVIPKIEETVKISNIVPNDFKIIIHRIDFIPDRPEPRTLFPGVKRSPAISPIKITPIRPIEVPPEIDKRNLEERLKCILMPPIHEILSDPQLGLPEKPHDYQATGIKWLYDRNNALLADEMGLGKTMQAIIAARILWRQGIIKQILVICPKTLISNWKTEFCKWWPQVVHNITIAGTDRQFFLKLGMPNIIVKIINYESLSRELEWLGNQKFFHDLIIIDEAQRIKSSGSKASQAVKALQATRKWALTGTPLENKIDDLVSIFGFVEPNLIDYNDFEETIRKKIRPYILRRRTDEVDIELPEIDEQDIEIDLEEEQYNTYKKMEENGVVELNEKGDSITVTHVFALINKLRQICNFCPVSGRSAKLEQLLKDMEEIKESTRKALIFSQFVSEDFGLKRIAKILGSEGFKNLQLYGEIPSNQRDAVKEQFDNDKNISSMLLNFKVGGVGLNLQSANYVYLFDRWWNPAVEDQAIKRVHRIGQKQKVIARKFYCKNTIEERILIILAKKRREFRRIIDENRPAENMGLTEEEIFSLFNIKVRPRKYPHKKETGELIQFNLDSMSPSEFEVLVAEVYEKQGYKITITAGSHDRGIDIIAEKYVGQAREKVVIQCKHQKSVVGRPILQQLWGVVSDDHSITRGDLLTSSNFSSEAKDFAKNKRLTIIDRNDLDALALEYKVAILK